MVADNYLPIMLKISMSPPGAFQTLSHKHVAIGIHHFTCCQCCSLNNSPFHG